MGEQMPSPQRPSLGRIVHYVLPQGSSRQGEHRAAIITSTFEGPNVNLTVLLDQANESVNCQSAGFTEVSDVMARAWSAPYDETGQKPGSWHWPERFEGATPATGS